MGGSRLLRGGRKPNLQVEDAELRAVAIEPKGLVPLLPSESSRSPQPTTWKKIPQELMILPVQSQIPSLLHAVTCIHTFLKAPCLCFLPDGSLTCHHHPQPSSEIVFSIPVVF